MRSEKYGSVVPLYVDDAYKYARYGLIPNRNAIFLEETDRSGSCHNQDGSHSTSALMKERFAEALWRAGYQICPRLINTCDQVNF